LTRTRVSLETAFICVCTTNQAERRSSATHLLANCHQPTAELAKGAGQFNHVTFVHNDSLSSSKWHVWFASRCPDRRLSTWQVIAASCPTALGALCGQLTFRLAWCRGHSTVTATELLQLLNLACATLFRSSCAIQTSPTDCSDDS